MKGVGTVGLCLVLMIGCGSSTLVDESELESEVSASVELDRANELTQQLLQVRLDEIPDDVDQEAALSALLHYKQRRGQEAEVAWEKIGEQPEYRQLSLVRIAQGYLNFSCTILDSPTPERLAVEGRQRYREVLADAALKVMENADKALAKAIAVDPGVYDGISPDDLRARLATSSEQVADSCQATRSDWMPTNAISGQEMLNLACAAREGGCQLTPTDSDDPEDSIDASTIAH